MTGKHLPYDQTILCPLCKNLNITQPLKSAIDLDYWFCHQCNLIFVDRSDLPDPDDEKERYLTHQNGIQYPDYVQFLNQAVEPASRFLKSGMRGLDYGCGHTPTLSILLKQKGFDCDDYDPFFYPDLPRGPFDFVFVTEAAEHFFQPGNEFKKIKDLLRVGGILTIMTVLWTEADLFSDWYYAKDFSHVSFYHKKTMQAVCDLFGFQRLFTDNERIVILKN